MTKKKAFLNKELKIETIINTLFIIVSSQIIKQLQRNLFHQ